MNEVNASRIVLSVSGMTCGHCALNVRQALEEQGVEHVVVDHSKGVASFVHSNGSVDAIINSLNEIGYPSKIVNESTKKASLAKTLEIKFAFSLILTLPLLVHMFSNYGLWHNPWLQLALATPVMILGVIHFGLSALGSLRRRSPNMDVLIFIGSTAAYLYSLYGTVFGLGHNFLFYETSASIITLVLFGNLLEKTALAKTTKSVEDLHSLRPQNARIIIGDNNFKEVEANNLKLGDKILVRTGETIPADGIIISGSADINESMISGESLPVSKTVGEKVIGATVLEKGPITVEVSATGENSVLYSIIRLVERALTERPAIQEFADKVSNIFVPLILVISALTFIVSILFLNLPVEAAMLRAIAVLVISCPCAMGLATPAAVVVSVGNAAKLGILAKGGRSLELLAGVKKIVFDKTGTLTTGNFKVRKFEISGISREEAEGIVLALEQQSTHPIAKSLVAYLHGKTAASLNEITENRGVGMRGLDTSGNIYELGAGTNGSHLVLKRNNNIVCSIDIHDEIRPHAKEAITFLKTRGLHTIMLSGDSRAKCQELASELGIEEVFAEQKPDQKLQLIEKLSKESTVAFVGDGINDAPALTRATVGISLSSATDVAVNSSHLVLLGNDLSALMRAFEVADKTLLTIKQNLFWALAYNVVAIPVAAAGLLSPIWAAFSMAFSDVIVIGNSLRLKFQGNRSKFM